MYNKIFGSLITIGLFTGSAVVAQAQTPGDMPPNPEVGKCYAKVTSPAKYAFVREKTVVKPASTRLVTTPPKYRLATKSVVVKEGSERIEVIPATYKTIRERVVVSEATTKLIPVPAQYKTAEKKVLVRAAEKVWKKGNGSVEKVDKETGEILCLVEKPAVYKTVQERVLVKPASTREVVIPAKYDFITKKVVDTPATTRTIRIPEVRKNIQVREIVEPAQERTVAIPATYDFITKKVVDVPAKVEWKSILCETNATPDLIKQVQVALKRRGISPGDIDGILGSDTLSAVKTFQKRNRLSVGYLTEETLEALNVQI